MKIPMPAAVLAGGASRRMGRDKGALPYGAATLAEFQTARLFRLFSEVWLVTKREPDYPFGPARILLDDAEDLAPVHGLRRVLRESPDRVFVLAVDLPALSAGVIELLGRRGMATGAPALLPEAGGTLQPLAAVWRREALPELDRRVAQGELSLHGLATALGAEVLSEREWRTVDPSGNSFLNVNTLEEYVQLRERA
jgi:molybdopterin-guanine dinucleotide biosynthesis protein A